MEYIIRTAEEKDLPELIELCQKHADYEQANYNPRNKQDLLKAAIFSETPKLFCFVAECNVRLIGYYTYTFDFSTWNAKTFLYLDCLYLEPEYRGMKIGETIFHNIKEVAIQNNCVNIQWQTPTFNERAIKFYNRIGAHGKDKVRFFLPL